MTRNLPATRGRPISITELTKPRSGTSHTARGDSWGRPPSSPGPEQDFAKITRTLPAPWESNGAEQGCRAREGGAEDGGEGPRWGVLGGAAAHQHKCLLSENICSPRGPQQPRSPQAPPVAGGSTPGCRRAVCSAQRRGCMLRTRKFVSFGFWATEHRETATGKASRRTPNSKHGAAGPFPGRAHAHAHSICVGSPSHR